MKKHLKIALLGLVTIISLVHVRAVAQDDEIPAQAEFKDPVTRTWINTYGNIRLTSRLFWIAETHFRFQEKGGTPFAGQFAQVYNRHAISYLFSKEFNASLGGVLRINLNTNQQSEAEQRAVPEWRIWHQYQFANPLSRMMVYHRIRIEHRWSKGFLEESEYIYRNRYRYMLKFKVPLNKPKLSTRTFYFSPEAELIMQSGKQVINSPMEDLRLHASFGYIINPRLTVATGLMYSQGQELNNGSVYGQKWTARFHVYFSPDFRKVKNKIPAIHFTD